jgi:hypothetical protein
MNDTIEQLKAQLELEREMHEQFLERQAQGVKVVNSFKNYDFAYAKKPTFKMVKAG